ncbi:MAG: nicotinate-nucleotide adenylyltransferase [Methylobacteriaceae bacterium]|nr:nicotinate-nucleotide adenylyltransferase [Methylobacteriaceae bacterium]
MTDKPRLNHTPSFPVRLPATAPGLTVGLYGGSFNPPHAGHRLVSELALERLRLDRVWWIVTPGNPLKNTSGLPGLKDRMAACRRIARSPRFIITGFEESLNSRYTVDTLRYLKKRRPDVRFVWIMGADNLATFHLWEDWQDIVDDVLIAVVDRPGATLKAQNSRAGRFLARRRLPSQRAAALTRRRPPCWTYLYGPRSAASSTELRRRGVGVEKQET